ncbi:hypothetical protein TI03_02230 [Achromatium sp. WMS1]|nr:hypothetical protein TI03_02230 [Achromatium sp. WMS1]
MAMQVTKLPNNSLLVNIPDKQELYMAYMGFLKNGGLFITSSPTLDLEKEFTMGSNVILLLTLPNDPQRLPVAARVVWITPLGTHKQPGIGIQFHESDDIARNKIEALLAGSHESSRPTYTL